MTTADLQNNVDGGIQAKRGFRFETYGLLFYLLIRLKKYPDLEVIIEPEEGEDAKFIYPADQSNEDRRIIELIQYKKREAKQTDAADSGEALEDAWREGEITPHKFKKGRAHHYTWFYIQQAVLRSIYLNWERDLEEAANNTTFGLEHERDLEVILS